MDLAEASFHLRHRRGMYLMDDRYETVVAFLVGLSAASDGRLLEGFNEFVADRVLGRRTPFWWGALVRDSDGKGAPLEDEAAVALLLDLLEEFAAGQE